MRLERGSAVPLHLQLERQLRDAARTGRLRPGVSLPSTRALAGELGVARGVVSDAYSQLAAEGYLPLAEGAATRVAERAAATPAAAPPAAPPRAPRFDFRPGRPTSRCSRARRGRPRCARRSAGADERLRYPDTHGAVELRGALADLPRAGPRHRGRPGVDRRSPRAWRRASRSPAARWLARTGPGRAGGSGHRRRSGPARATGLEPLPIPSTATESTSARSTPAPRTPCSSRRPTSSRPASCSPRLGAPS